MWGQSGNEGTKSGQINNTLCITHWKDIDTLLKLKISIMSFEVNKLYMKEKHSTYSRYLACKFISKSIDVKLILSGAKFMSVLGPELKIYSN